MMKLALTLAMSPTLVGFSFLQAQEIEIEKLDPNMTLEKADTNGVAWFDPRTAPFRLVGFPWISDDKVYRRLPVKPEWPIRPAVNSLANSTAGGQIQFQSDSPKVLLRVKLRQPSGMSHMPATGQSGFDLYLAKAGEQFQADFVKTRRAAGDTNLHFLGGGTLLGDHADECTVDGVHPTDLGFMKMANGVNSSALIASPKSQPCA